MLCSFDRLIYPKTAAVNQSGYMVALYRPHEKIVDASGLPIGNIKVVGYCLPTVSAVNYDLHGHWSKSKYGMQYELETYEEVVTPTKEGITAYLASGLIKGVGIKTAARIYETFGNDTLKILDDEPQKLLKVRGISQKKLDSIIESYLAYRGARDLITVLAPHGITPNKAIRIYTEYGANAIHTVKEHPFRLCEMAGIGFSTADRIAQAMGLDPCAQERLEAAILHALKEAEGAGHLCMDRFKLITATLELLDTEGLTKLAVSEAAMALLQRGRIVLYGEQTFRREADRAERDVANKVNEILKDQAHFIGCDYESEIESAERKFNISLAEEQKNAVKTCLGAALSIISGGPGTGKTLIQKVLLDIYHRHNPAAKIICCAPTGRAARRMHESTGYPASTIHKVLGLMAGEDGAFNEPAELDADLIVVDEVSMMDIYLARDLFASIPHGAQVVLVGDADQLASVGPGAVLSELIKCGKIPFVKLDKVYRQAVDSRIPVNASIIRHNGTHLEYGPDFRLVETGDFAEAANLMEKIYLEEVAAYGVDNVLLLSPFRSRTETGVNAMNGRLREKVNPSRAGICEISSGNHVFREGDKVMQVQNKGDVNNGDIGYIRKIAQGDDDTIMYIDFCDGRIVEYEPADLDLLDLAYASTVHKSQGSEYDSVILNLQSGHYIMLKRPLLYTAITRAKKKVVIVGERKAICIAIRTVDAEKRGTMLSERIRVACKTQAV